MFFLLKIFYRFLKVLFLLLLGIFIGQYEYQEISMGKRFVQYAKLLQTAVFSSFQQKVEIVLDKKKINSFIPENILEEVVANMLDKLDESSFTFHEISKNVYLVNVNMEVSDFNESLNVNIPKGNYETLSGFLLQKFNRIPNIGEETIFEKLRIKVYKANNRGIQLVTVTKIE